jgi:hypothetical protein
MALKWTDSAERDLVRIHAFLASVNPPAAAKVIRQLVAGAEQLLFILSWEWPLTNLHRGMCDV